MKKSALFLTIFLFFGVLAAQEVQNEQASEQNEPEVAAEEVKENGEAAPAAENQESDLKEDHEKPKIFYIQPAVGFGTGMSAFRPTLALDIDFLLAHSAIVNYYIGLDLDLRWPMIDYELLDPIVDSAFLVNGVFDVKTGTNPHIRSVSLWISLGLEMFYGREINDGEKREATLFYMVGWATGVDLVFKPSVVLKLGIDNFLGYYPDLTFAVGYRF